MIGQQADVIRNARLVGPSADLAPVAGLVDVALADGRVLDIAPAGALRVRGAEIDADGRWVLPGLWDRHVHMLQWALVAERVPLGDVASAAEAAARMGSSAPIDDRRVGTGFRDAFWPDAPSLALLDAATGEVPTYLINADVHSVWLNSAALRREGFPIEHSGMLREEDAFEISRRLNAVDPAIADRQVATAARAAAARGVVGIVDLDMAWNAEAWTRRVAGGFDALRVDFGIYPQHLERAIAEGLRSGDTVPGSEIVRVGSLKVITDGSLGTRTAACSHPYPDDTANRGLLTVDPATLTAWMTRATGSGLSCAIHAIGDVANSHALDAFAATGATGTIEHAQLVARADFPRFARLGVTASVQPEHALDDRDLTDTVWGAQPAQPYPLRSLADSGANVVFGSDAPVSPLDPWAAIAGAVFRTRGGRAPWQEHESVDILTALDASTAGGSSSGALVQPGAAADLVLCDSDPVTADETALRAMTVSATLLAGRVTYAG